MHCTLMHMCVGTHEYLTRSLESKDSKSGTRQSGEGLPCTTAGANKRMTGALANYSQHTSLNKPKWSGLALGDETRSLASGVPQCAPLRHSRSLDVEKKQEQRARGIKSWETEGRNTQSPTIPVWIFEYFKYSMWMGDFFTKLEHACWNEWFSMLQRKQEKVHRKDAFPEDLAENQFLKQPRRENTERWLP